MENLGIESSFWKHKKVFVTGHTGFKGGWLALWLSVLGAKVYGYALSPATEDTFLKRTKVDARLEANTIADIRDHEALLKAVRFANPDIVFHLAAQPLVRHSYLDPLETYSVNIMGTVNLFEAIRETTGVRAVVNVTTDKCYENREWVWPYREYDALGGHDPYASSKACSELISSAYRRSFFDMAGVSLATARAGNVVGGGDWSQDRLLPDVYRALKSGRTFAVRSPNAIRPWQHVIEPLAGYLTLAERLYVSGLPFATAWNFGPDVTESKSVQWILNYIARKVPNFKWSHDDAPSVHEANILNIDSAMAKAKLGWSPRWTTAVALEHTWSWYESWQGKGDVERLSLFQIQEYLNTKVKNDSTI